MAACKEHMAEVNNCERRSSIDGRNEEVAKGRKRTYSVLCQIQAGAHARRGNASEEVPRSNDKEWTLGNAVVIYRGGHECMKLLLVPAIAQSIRTDACVAVANQASVHTRRGFIH